MGADGRGEAAHGVRWGRMVVDGRREGADGGRWAQGGGRWAQGCSGRGMRTGQLVLSGQGSPFCWGGGWIWE